MVTDQQRLILMIKTSHASGKGLACNRKRLKKRAENQLTRTEKLIGLI